MLCWGLDPMFYNAIKRVWQWVRARKPIFIENSRVPVLLSYVSPININAISFGLCVWSRSTMDERVRRHETIHFQQQIELLFVLQWILYGLFHLVGLVRYRNGEQAYRENPFEREAYGNDKDEDYLKNRKRYAWVRYIL